jgi:hypothetical protein
MTQFVIANNVNTQLAAAALSTATTLTLASATNLPTLTSGQVMPLTLNDAATGAYYEIVYVTAISGVTLTVERAQEGTGALNWSLGDYAYCAPTAGTVATADGNPSNTFYVAPATASQHAVQFGQVAGVVGSVRNLVMSVTAASASATLTADEIVVESALGGLRYCLASFNKTINLATTGAGGMDTGTAPVSASVGIYAIYNPATGASALLAQNTSALIAPSVYSGANMPAGYTASALVSSWRTNSSGQLVPGIQSDRHIDITPVVAINSATQQATPTQLIINQIVPPNAKTIDGAIATSATAATSQAVTIFPTSSGGIGGRQVSQAPAAGASMSAPFYGMFIPTNQTIWYETSNSSGTQTYNISINGYSF